MTTMLPLLLCFKLENSCIFERKIAELDLNTSAEERERIRIDFWNWIVQSHGIPTLNDDEIELKMHMSKCGSASGTCDRQSGIAWMMASLHARFFK